MTIQYRHTPCPCKVICEKLCSWNRAASNQIWKIPLLFCGSGCSTLDSLCYSSITPHLAAVVLQLMALRHLCLSRVQINFTSSALETPCVPQGTKELKEFRERVNLPGAMVLPALWNGFDINMNINMFIMFYTDYLWLPVWVHSKSSSVTASPITLW